MHAFNYGYTFSAPASDCMPFLSSADAIVNVRHTARFDVRPAVASPVNKSPLEFILFGLTYYKQDGTVANTFVNKSPLEFILFGPLARFARQESGVAPWELVQPLQVRVVTDSDGMMLASDDFFLIYGVGETVAAALADYAVTLVEFYHLISASVKENPMDTPLFDRLRTYLRECRN